MQQLTILVADADDALVSFLRRNLEREGYRVMSALDGEAALVLAKQQKSDLILLDWILPRVSGFDVCGKLRGCEETRNIPIIMLTAWGEESDRIRALDAGADDYMTKPFSMTELLARLRAVLRRNRASFAEDVIRAGDIEINRSAHRVRCAGQDVRLGPTEFRILDHFVQHPGRVLSRDQLRVAVWGSDGSVDARTVDVHIGRLRKALNGPTHLNPIHTVRSAGYRLDGMLLNRGQVETPRHPACEFTRD